MDWHGICRTWHQRVGGATLSDYDANGNLLLQASESSDSANAPAVTTVYTYDADGHQVSSTTGAATTLSYYDPDGNVYCSVSAKAYALQAYSSSDPGGYQCPAWSAGWATSPPGVGALYSSAPGATQAKGVTTSFYDADGELAQQSGPDQATTISLDNADGAVVCAEDATDMVATLSASASATYPYACPSTPLTTPPSNGSGPGYEATIYDPNVLNQAWKDNYLITQNCRTPSGFPTCQDLWSFWPSVVTTRTRTRSSLGRCSMSVFKSRSTII